MKDLRDLKDLTTNTPKLQVLDQGYPVQVHLPVFVAGVEGSDGGTVHTPGCKEDNLYRTYDVGP